MGQGIIAHEFAKIIDQVAQSNLVKNINWESIIKEDTLYSNPLRLFGEVKQNIKLANKFIKIVEWIGRLPI